MNLARSLLAILLTAALACAAEPHWAFQKPTRPEVPTAGVNPAARQDGARQDGARQPNNPIDAFLLAELAKHGLAFAPPADKATLLRRVYLDLVGVPPTRDELHAFLNDNSAHAYEKVVDRLLDDPRYGERWARHWMDVWRYSDWYGRRAVPDVMNSYPQIWRWRDWIVRSLNQDRGYDRMIQEMLAADELCPDDDQNVVATGFLVRNWFKWNYNQWMRDDVEHVGKAFLGLTLNCCHCHDHKYDPITQEEYFRFRAFFEPLELRHDRVAGEPDPGPFKKYVYAESYGPIKSGAIRVFDEKLDAPTVMYSGGDERNKIAGKPPVTPGAPAFLGGDKLKIEPVKLPATAWYPGLKPFVRQEEIAKREAALKLAEAEWAKVKDRPKIIGWLHDAPAPEVELAEAQLNAARLDLAAIRARIHADDVAYLGAKGDTKTAATAAARAERELALAVAIVAELKAKSALAAGRAAKSPQLAQLEQQAKTATTNVAAARNNLGKDSTAYSPLSPQYPKTSTGRRLALAKWIASPDNPLTARVAVNHLWGWHFGRPIVESTFDFGHKGQKPSHPQLMDWLAVELMQNGWKLKPLHKQILLSVAYRQSSRMRNAEFGMRNEEGRPAIPHSAFRAPHSEDPDNRLLWHFPTQRMEAEVVRDSLLSASGELDSAMGGPEIPHEQGQTLRRRSIYFAHHGESKMAWLELFDAANPCDCYRRSTSVMPQQALALSNSELELHCGRALARRLSAAVKNDDEFVRAAFEQILSRPPSAAEAAIAGEFLIEQRKMFEANRSALVATPDGPAVEPGQRARENLVHALFNHNDFVTAR